STTTGSFGQPFIAEGASQARTCDPAVPRSFLLTDLAPGTTRRHSRVEISFDASSHPPPLWRSWGGRHQYAELWRRADSSVARGRHAACGRAAPQLDGHATRGWGRAFPGAHHARAAAHSQAPGLPADGFRTHRAATRRADRRVVADPRAATRGADRRVVADSRADRRAVPRRAGRRAAGG